MICNLGDPMSLRHPVEKTTGTILCEWGMSHVWTSHVMLQANDTKVQVSFAEYRLFYMALLQKIPIWVMSCYRQMTLVETKGTIWCEWVMSHTWMSHVTHMNESCHTHEWVMSHTWMSHVTHMNESCHTSQASDSSRKERRHLMARAFIKCLCAHQMSLRTSNVYAHIKCLCAHQMSMRTSNVFAHIKCLCAHQMSLRTSNVFAHIKCLCAHQISLHGS